MATATESLRVLVVDDHDVVHWGFRLLLERQAWVESCAAAGYSERGKIAYFPRGPEKRSSARVELLPSFA